MSVIVLTRKFEEVPKAVDIMQILLDNTTVDEDKAAKAFEAFMGPMTDFLKMFHLIGTMKETSERHAALLKEQEELVKAVEAAKVEATFVKESLAKIVSQGEAQKTVLAKDIADLEKTKVALSQEVETEQAAKLRLDSTVSAEYDRLRKEMLAQVETDRKEAQKKLDGINASIVLAQDQLSGLEAKRAAFLKSLGA